LSVLGKGQIFPRNSEDEEEQLWIKLGPCVNGNLIHISNHQATNVYRGSGGNSPCSLSLGLNGGDCHFTPGEKIVGTDETGRKLNPRDGLGHGGTRIIRSQSLQN
jgi:hypothetical protein